MSPASTASQRLYAARRFTRRLAATHYENFTVVSMLLPRQLRQHFSNIYAFCRHADDLADEIPDCSRSLELLADFRRDLLAVYDGEPKHPIHLALRDTIRRFDIPPQPFLDLIDAFEQDQRVSRYADFPQLLDYCRRSANPVGRLVLYLSGYRDARRQELSDATCTALQLANFWQDVVPDWKRGRVYIPQEDLSRFGVSEADIERRRPTEAFAALMRFEVERTQGLFAQGRRLWPLVHPRVRTDIALYTLGGEAILKRIAAANYDVLTARPALSKLDKAGLLLRWLCVPNSPLVARRTGGYDSPPPA